MIYIEPEASKVVGARDVVEGGRGEVVAVVNGERVQEGAVVDEGYDVGIVCVAWGHEDADVWTGFGDCCCEILLRFALGEDDNAELFADYLGNWCSCTGCR